MPIKPVLATGFFVGELMDKLLACAKTFEELLDSNYLTFRYRPQNNPTSTIIAEFLLSADFQGNDVYIFLDKKEHAENYFCRSFFPKTDKDYTVGQIKYTLLRKEKTTLSTRESVGTV